MKVVLSSLLEISLSYFGGGANHFLPSCKSALESLLAGYHNSNYIKSIDNFSSPTLYCRSLLNGSWNPSRQFLIITFQWISKWMIC